MGTLKRNHHDMKNVLSVLLWITLMVIPFFGFSDTGGTPLSVNQPTLFNLIQTDGILEVELQYSFAALEASKKTGEESTAIFRYRKEGAPWQELSADVKARGRFRRRICEYTPIKIDFSKKQLRAMGLLPYDDFKLVTHCMPGSEGKDAVLREYLAYRLYAQLTDQTIRAQLVEITYRDTDSRNKHSAYGILLEDVDELAGRTNSVECEDCFGLAPEQFDQDNLKVHGLFQYMIGNLDWSLKMTRNIKIMQDQESGRYWLAPYDFDFAGLVDASYAIPNTNYGQTSVQDRLFIGPEFSPEELNEAKSFFMSRKELLLSEVKNLKGLKRSSRKAIIEYLEAFYLELQDNSIGFAGGSKSNQVQPIR